MPVMSTVTAPPEQADAAPIFASVAGLTKLTVALSAGSPKYLAFIVLKSSPYIELVSVQRVVEVLSAIASSGMTCR